MTNLTMSETLGEVRKASKMFRAFEKLEEVLTSLANLEQTEKALQESIKHLTLEKEALNTTCDELVAQANKVEELIKVKVNESNTKVSTANAEARDIINKAKSQAAEIINSAQKQIVNIQEDIINLNKAKDQAMQDLAEARRMLEKFKHDADKERDRIRLSFGVK